MKQRILAWCLCILLLGLTACSTTENDTTPPPSSAQTAPPSSDQTAPTNSELPEPLQNYLNQAGLINPDLFSVSNATTFAQGITGTAYLFLANDTNVADTSNSFVFLAVVHNQTVLLNCLNTNALDGTVSCGGDLDGDDHSEILVHLTLGATGGAGSYSTLIFNVQKGQLTKLYDFDNFDTGYSIELLKDKKYRITNRFTDYSAEFTRVVEDNAYFDFWYNGDGTIQELGLLVDSFFECTFLEPSGGGVCELSIRQYTSLVDHSDYVGDAVSVLTYDKESKTFKVTQASFDPQ